MHTFYALWRNVIPDYTHGRRISFSRYSILILILFSFVCHVLFCCINLSSVFILTLLIHIIIASSSVVLLHFVDLCLCILDMRVCEYFYAYMHRSYIYLYTHTTISACYWVFFTHVRIY